MTVISSAFVVAAAALFSCARAARLSDAQLVALYGRAPAAAPRALLAPRDAAQSLRDAAAAAGVFVGSAIDENYIRNTSDPYGAIAAGQFNMYEAENACKFPATEPALNRFDLTECLWDANFSSSNAPSAFRLHNMVWGGYNPSWLLNGGFSPAQLAAISAAHIKALGAGLGAASYAVDVVNEAIADGGSEVFKPAPPWYPALPTYVRDAFVAARASFPPSVKLMYNEYGAEGLGAKSDKVYQMVQGFVAEGTPIDGVGFQMHVSVDAYPSKADVSANMQRLVALGLEVHITEMDVRCTPDAQGNICGADRLAAQAAIYGDMMQACLDNSKPTNANGKGGCKALQVWGITDKYTWLWDFDNPK
jgi:endo-1,4-beta-xylanase